VKQSTIYAASVLWRRKPGSSMLVTDPEIELLPDGVNGPRRFKIKAVENDERRGLVEALLNTRYAWRGYKAVKLPTDMSVTKFTLAAVEEGSPIGSITVSFDSPAGLSVDDAFRTEVDELRKEGRRICEFVRLAVDPTVGTKRVLAALFHVAYIVAHRLRGYDTLLIEVNPRHVRYYQRMLGFNRLSEERLNRSVNAPAVLLGVDFSYVMKQIGEFGGQFERMSAERSLYPAFFSLTEEAGITVRMKAKQALLEQRKLDVTESERTVVPMATDFQASDIVGS
jgi:hypothetical protein